MGICFSCLGLNGDDGDDGERTSLLGNNNIYSDENNYENLLKQQQRQNELSLIVNDLSDNLIDVSTFLSKDVFATANGVQNGHNDTGAITTEDSANLPLDASDNDKSLPYLWPLDKKLQLMKDVSTSHPLFEIKPPSESLYVVF
ncbi:hypothetical protein HF325_002680 [Metschnikowia pulcherrima]|uniref:Uncharacterized protein n=1 Tax=Metschnikowia pulcherrima TaxID=27326 RepID=A0A8H7LDB9_9ASCO|nr:hypothetical protein HF325_002680 [Metschnikowia pulcherrima]